MKTAGIDLATTAAKTAVCVVDWSEAGICVGFRDDATDHGLLRVCQDNDIEKVGIDCPFGWPAPFVAAISAHALGQAWPGRDHPVSILNLFRSLGKADIESLAGSIRPPESRRQCTTRQRGK